MKLMALEDPDLQPLWENIGRTRAPGDPTPAVDLE
jgi:hypothetical protein